MLQWRAGIGQLVVVRNAVHLLRIMGSARDGSSNVADNADDDDPELVD
jgi:hypothetical protein